MMTQFLPKYVQDWTRTVVEQPYSASIPLKKVEQITSEKLHTIYGWAMSEYFITRASLASASLNVLAGLTDIPPAYDAHQFLYPALGTLALSAVGLASILRDGTINSSLQSIDRKIILPTQKNPAEEPHLHPAM